MKKEEKEWEKYKAHLDSLKSQGIISETLWYLMCLNIRKQLKLPIVE